MNRNLAEMVVALNGAGAFRTEAAALEVDANFNHEMAASDGADAFRLEGEAKALRSKARTDSSSAEADQYIVDGLEAAEATETEMAEVHHGLAGVEEAASEADAAEATADASEATRFETKAHGEEVAIALCEFLPILDVACDVLGGISAVGLDAAAAVEAVRAATEVAASAASRTERNTEIALAGELETMAAEDDAAADAAERDALALESQSREEQLAAEERETAAQGLATKAEQEEALAVEEETAAADAEAESAAQTGKALASGVAASWNGIMASLFGIVSFLFFLFRSCTNFLVPALRQEISGLAKMNQPGDDGGPPVLHRTSIGRDASYVLHHIGIFLVISATFQVLLDGLGDNSLRARGGVILCFALTGGLLQTLSLHMLPNAIMRLDHSWTIVLHFVRRMLVLPVLFSLEILFVCVVLGGKVFAQHHVSRIMVAMLWMCLALSVTMHIALLEIPRLQQPRMEPYSSRVFDKSSQFSKATNQEQEPSEMDSLLSPEGPPKRTLFSLQPKPWFSQLWEDIQSLQLPLEVLILACLSAVIFHSTCSTRLLWPASKALMISSRLEWLLPVAMGILVALLGLCIISVWWGVDSGMC
jgi:chemotaxis protein histidine kinase CheA